MYKLVDFQKTTVPKETAAQYCRPKIFARPKKSPQKKGKPGKEIQPKKAAAKENRAKITARR